MSDNKNNTGYSNTGNWNTGYSNTGYSNTGNWNTGYSNTGNWNTGKWNTGNCNTGDWNTGYSNTGNWNTGNCNTGNCNTGYSNTGDWNTGYSNTGNWNTGKWNTGYFNNTTPNEVLIFGKLYNRERFLNSIHPEWIYFDLAKWIPTERMTDKEKLEFTSHNAWGGYVREYTYKEAAKIAWDNATHEDKMLTYTLPNFDADIAQDIFGIDFKAYFDSQNKCKFVKENIDAEVLTINGKKYKLID